MALRNSSGNMDKWVPFHTVLGPHNKFVVEDIYHAKQKTWNTYRRFLLNFVFRAHCKPDVFKVQLPLMSSKSFWKNPVAGFCANSPMHRALSKFRAEGNALQTGAFLIIPKRLVKDDDENLVRNLLQRSQRLIGLAQKLWPILKNAKLSTSQIYDCTKNAIQDVYGLGPTWVKMLMVEVDIAQPSIRLLQDRCEIGSGALEPLRAILTNEGVLATASSSLPDRLVKLRDRIVKYTGEAKGKHFKRVLCRFESEARKRFKRLPLMVKQMQMSRRPFSCSTLQVQLCEFRQLSAFIKAHPPSA